MEQWERDSLRAQNSELIAGVEGLREQFDHGMNELVDVYDKVQRIRVEVTSSDRLVKVTSNSAGVVMSLELARNALHNNTAERLTQSINEAIHGAAQAAFQAMSEVTAPLQAVAEGVPEVTEMVTGLPDLARLRQELATGTTDF
ncbi:MAG: YbaB/EbfC family nucleoid-associated protein [Mycobacteriaceae bacterium]|nr:YbaB/EbfC family nucleoid-associated protein [Mycobacteriaceae bacterium]